MENEERSVSSSSSSNTVVAIIFPLMDNLVVCQNSSTIESRSHCFYFPDLGEIFYYELSEEIQKQQTLSSFLKKQLQQKPAFLEKNIDLSQENLVFTNFSQISEEITSNSYLSYKQCSRVVVKISNLINPPSINKNKRFLIVNTKLDQKYKIEYDLYKKFRIKELIIIQGLNNIGFTSLFLNGKIINSYQTLESAHLPIGTHIASPLFSFQVFYHDMHKVYETLQKEGFNFQEAINLYAKNPQEGAKIQQKYNNLRSQNLSKCTQFTIIYLMNYLDPQEQKNYIDKHFKGNIGKLQKSIQTQSMCLMLHCIEEMPTIDQETIYIVEQIEDQSLADYSAKNFARIKTFARAGKDIKQMKMRQNHIYYVYQIQHLTAKNVQLYCNAPNGYTHIILPYTEYFIEDIQRKNRNYHFKMFEIPLPKHLETNLIFWINDNLSEGRIFQEKENSTNSQVLLIKNNTVLEKWLQRYYCLTTMRRYCVVCSPTDMLQGLKTVQLVHKHLGTEINIMISVKTKKQMEQTLKNKGLMTDLIKIASNSSAFLPFISSCFKTYIIEESLCDKCECSIF